MNNAELLSENSQPVFDSMALCKEKISRENVLKKHISQENIFGIDNSGKNLPLEHEEKEKIEEDVEETEPKEEEEDQEGRSQDAVSDLEKRTAEETPQEGEVDQKGRSQDAVSDFEKRTAEETPKEEVDQKVDHKMQYQILKENSRRNTQGRRKRSRR